jgi:hypothetical protein
MRLSDKNIAAIAAAAEDCTLCGYGDVLLLCAEVQERRANNENIPTTLLADRLIQRLDEGELLTGFQRNEIQRRAWHDDGTAQVPPMPVSDVPDSVTNERLMDCLIERINKSWNFRDSQVLAMYHGMKQQGYFQNITFVDTRALQQVLTALASDQGHLIRELQVTRMLPVTEGEPLNPINQLIKDMKAGDPQC